MDYETELDLLTDVTVLDVDLPTFLDDLNRPFGEVEGVFCNLQTNAELYAVNEFGGGNNIFSKVDGFEPFASLLCTQNSTPNDISKNQNESHQRQNESPSSFLAPWHENFVDVEDEFAFFDIQPNTETTFLQNVLWQAETSGNVDDFLGIVDESASKNSNGIQNPQEIFEEIFRECTEIDASSPRLVSEIELAEGGVGEVLEYYTPSVGASTTGTESDDDSVSRSSNYTPGSTDGSESTTGTEMYSNSDHSFAAHGSISKKFNKKAGQLSSRRGSSTKKKSQNRVAASRYRSKKKTERIIVESEMSILEGRNVQLKSTVDDLQREISYLKGFLSEIRAAKGVKGGKKKKQAK